MRFRFRIRTLLLLTFISALGVYWAMIPEMQHRAEQEHLARLATLIFPARERSVARKTVIPAEWKDSWRRRVHADEVFERVEYLDLAEGEISDDVIDVLLEFKHLRHVVLNRTRLNDQQCLRLAALPNLYIVDCVDTPVSYETLVRMRREHPQFCHLAHRRAISELGRMRTNYVEQGENLTAYIRGPVTDKMIRSIQFLRRPVSTFRLSGSNLRPAVLDQLRSASPDSQFSLILHHSREDEAVVPAGQFRLLTSAGVSSLQVTNASLDVACRPDSDSTLQFLHFNNVADLTCDDTIVPPTVEKLTFSSTIPHQVDLSHCHRLSSVWIFDDWGDEALMSLLTAPALEKVVYFARQPASQSLQERFKDKGIALCNARGGDFPFVP